MGAVRPGPCMREASDLSSALSRKVLCVDTPCRRSAAGLLPQEASEGPKSFSRVSDRHSSGCESCLTVGDSTGISFSLQFLPSGADPAGSWVLLPHPRRELVMAEH